jgi:hypothetical protein
MNKFFFIVLLFFCTSLRAQDTLPIPKKTKITFTQKDIQIDTATIEAKHFDKNFKKKYPYVYEYKTPEKNAWDRFKEWLANIIKNLFSISSSAVSMNVVTIILRILAVIVILFVVYLIVKAIMNKEGQWIFGKNSDKKIIHYDIDEKNLHLIDFEKRIQETLQSGQKRLCIRYYYLWLLKNMAANRLIVWDLEKTNSDYLHEIKEQTRKNEFAYLSYLYNYIWYGEFELDDFTFEKTKKAFENTIKSIRNG